jgi:dTMP kinase
MSATEPTSIASVELSAETLQFLEPARAYPGALIVVEGIDGSGKSTQLYLLKRWLEIGGYRLHFTEWNSSPLVKSATRRGKQRRLLTPTTFSLLHAADFADRCERQILPLLHSGYLVLADRYIYTSPFTFAPLWT